MKPIECEQCMTSRGLLETVSSSLTLSVCKAASFLPTHLANVLRTIRLWIHSHFHRRVVNRVLCGERDCIELTSLSFSLLCLEFRHPMSYNRIPWFSIPPSDLFLFPAYLAVPQNAINPLLYKLTFHCPILPRGPLRLTTNLCLKESESVVSIPFEHRQLDTSTAGLARPSNSAHLDSSAFAHCHVEPAVL